MVCLSIYASLPVAYSLQIPRLLLTPYSKTRDKNQPPNIQSQLRNLQHYLQPKLKMCIPIAYMFFKNKDDKKHAGEQNAREVPAPQGQMNSAPNPHGEKVSSTGQEGGPGHRNT